MKSYKPIPSSTTTFNVNNSIEGETIEQKVERIVNNKEPIKDGAPIIYTERKDGVNKAYNIRTDRFEVAVEAADKIAASYAARRENKGLTVVKKPEDSAGEEGIKNDSKSGDPSQ